jgi:hypothetical protein
MPNGVVEISGASVSNPTISSQGCLTSDRMGVEGCLIICQAGTEERYRSIALNSFSISALEEGGCSTPRPGRFNPGTHCTRGCVGLGTGMDGSGKPLLHWVRSHVTSPYSVFALYFCYAVPGKAGTKIILQDIKRVHNPSSIYKFAFYTNDNILMNDILICFVDNQLNEKSSTQLQTYCKTRFC